ncbi:hypothetical protein ASC66_01135 [Leifsonia sp. Root4]|uniref:PD-(D/E)XK nuclease-like domain-containing protein n=1 Tax=Leifsonia sp. Root4 TaxID=1736525 RepID=UPI0007005492|nr:PD-(D/E)XK nuclease-like domain-containing protein [Leifsonia sp. Root4]KQW07632.1 hypothetical protein ASC66_01135 [Leifsonia sp. Root4]
MTLETRLILDMPEAEYHAHPALSSTGAKTLIKDTPALFKHQILDGNRTDKKAFDVGHAIHAKVLGIGMGVVEIPVDVLSKTGTTGTDAARAFITEARAQGLIPLKKSEIDQVNASAEAVLVHKFAGPLFESDGISEATAFAHDDEFDIDLRARFDRISGNAMIDLKSAADASPRGFGKSVATYRYDIQQEFYRDVHTRATGERFERFYFVAVETSRLHGIGVGVYELDFEYELRAIRDVREAKRRYAHGIATGEWPTYSDDVVTLEAPFWLRDYDMNETEYEQ